MTVWHFEYGIPNQPQTYILIIKGQIMGNFQQKLRGTKFPEELKI
jgi:hypothetical protein